MIEDDYMELGDTGLVPIKDGWLLDERTGNTIDPDGRIYNKLNELVWDPFADEEYNN